MIWWAMVAGALIGLATSGFGFLAGGMIGLLMGGWLQNLMRSEVDRAVARQLSGLDHAPAPAPPEWDAADIAEETPEPAPPFRAEEPEPISRTSAQEQPLPVPPPAMPLPPGQQVIPSGEAPAGLTRSQFADEPSPIEALADRARDWLMGGNTIVRVGLVVLFIGLAFLARLVISAGLFPIEARLATIAAAGATLLGIGFAKRIERPDFGLHLQGAGVGVLYLTVFAASSRFYDVIPPGAAFAFMILFAALGASLAVLQNSLTMAMASFLGGYAVPFLLGGDAETPTGLFAYFTVLNLAVMGIAWKKSWRPLNLLGFAATFLMAGVWGLGAYQERHFLVCEVFLAISIAIYLATALLYAHNTPGKLGNFADSTLLFGTAIAGFGLQAGLVHDKPYASAWSAVVFGAVYLAVATWAFRRRDKGMALLSECLLAIGVGFVTLAVPLALDVKWTSAAWALEGAGAFWVGARQARWMPRAFGLALQAIGAVMVISLIGLNVTTVPVFNNGVISPLLIALPVLFTAWLLRRPLPHSGSDWAHNWQPAERALEKPWFLGGFAFAVIALIQEASRRVPASANETFPDPAYPEHLALFGLMLAVLGLMALADWLGRRHEWRVASWPARLSLPVIGWSFLLSLVDGRYVVNLPDLLAWILAIAIHFWLLRREDKHPETAAKRWSGLMHACGALLLTAMLADALFYAIDQADLWDSSWAGVVFLVAGIAVLMGIVRWAGPAAKTEQALRMGWPHNAHSRAYWWRAAMPLAALLYLGALYGTVVAEGVTAPLPYLPLLNPIDLTIALVLAALAQWRQMLQGADPAPTGAAPFTGNFALGAGALLAFVWINTIWTRTAHHYLGVGWYAGEVTQSQVVLTGFSILWTLMAMGLMLLARRRSLRLPWLAGAVLLGVVVAKLLFIDMSAAEGLARIVAFIGVGVLMLLIGYFVPLPPRKGDEEDKA